MASIATALRRFIVETDRIFHAIGGSSFARKVTKWKDALDTLRKRVRSIGAKFASLSTVRRIGENGEELVLMGGRIEAREFSSLIRTARSAEAYERATGALLSPTARTAFEHLDDVARTHFPDAVLARRARYLSDARETLIERGTLGRGERVRNAFALERLIREDPEMLRRVNALLKKTSMTRKILYVGGSIAVGSLSVSLVTRIAAKYSANNTGCFMYTQDLANGTKKCRVVGCSCPMPLMADEGMRPHGVSTPRPPVTCDESRFGDKMRVRNNECGRVAGERSEPYCVHCNWNETDSNSVDFVDRSTLPENAYLACERMDALDGLHEFIGSTLDSVFEIGSAVTKAAKNSLISSAKMAPWLITGGALLLSIAIIAYLWLYVVAPWLPSSSSPYASTALSQPPPPPFTTYIDRGGGGGGDNSHRWQQQQQQLDQV